MVVSDEHQAELFADERARKQEIRTRNRRTGLIVATIALAFFIGIIVKYTLLRH